MCHIKNLDSGVQNREYADTTSFDNWLDNYKMEEFPPLGQFRTTDYTSSSFDSLLQLPGFESQSQMPAYEQALPISPISHHTELKPKKRVSNEVEDLSNKRKKVF
jgi:hypothetical protein